MASILKLQRAAPPPPSAAREKLAAAIAELARAEAEIAAISRVLNTGACSWDATRAAQDRVDTATRTLAMARQCAGDRLVQIALGNADATGPDLKVARADLEESQDSLDALRQMRQTLEAKLDTANGSLLLKKMSVNDAVADVGREETGEKALKLIGELDTLHRLLVNKHIALAHLVSEGFIAEYGPAAPEGIGELTARFTYAPEQWRAAHMPIPSPSRNAWAAAIEALKTDPAAQLPEVI